MQVQETMLTTIDNPYNPFEDYYAWDSFDRRAGYHTASYLARIAQTSDELTEEEYQYEINSAIDEILTENITGKYIKIIK